MENKRGITLIALIITIVILLILAGVAIRTITGDNGILSKAQTSSTKTKQRQAEEKLSLELADLAVEKRVDSSYKDSDIDDRLIEKDMLINDNLVLVDGWLFEIDRSVPEIGECLGEGKLSDEIKINMRRTRN